MVWALYPFPGLSKIMVWALYGIFEESLGGGTSHCTFLQDAVSQSFTTKVQSLTFKVHSRRGGKFQLLCQNSGATALADQHEFF